MSIKTEKKQEIIKKFAATKGDTGSPQVQVAILTERINKYNEEEFDYEIDKVRLSYHTIKS